MKHPILAKFKRLSLITILALFAASLEAKQPNILFILADDLGWRDLSGEGSAFYESPNIDRIASEGTRFTQGYATCQVCSPSRASLMTGKYPARVDISNYIGAAEREAWTRNTKLLPPSYNHNLPHEETTLAEAFKQAGYTTFFAGKWHLGSEGSHPDDHGFDYNIGGHHKGSPPGGFFSPYNNPRMEDGPVGEYLPTRLGNETAAFIEAHKDEPFLAYLSFYMVHAPIQTTETLWKKYRAKADALPKPASRFLIDRTSPVRQVQDNPLYAGMIQAMDDAVGTVLATLDRLGLEKDTIVVFTSDNGGVSAGDGKATSNLPLRGGKGRQWEGGIREPFYIKWPGAPTSGHNVSTPVIGTDLYPTLLDIAGIPLLPKQHLDGVSLTPLLRGKSIEDRPLFWHYPHYGNQGGEPSSIIRNGNWKLIHYYEDRRTELYNLVDDPAEKRNLVSIYSEHSQELQARLKNWLDQVGATYPYPNPNYNAIKYAESEVTTAEVALPKLEAEHAKLLEKNWSPPKGWWEQTGERR
jgi:arylsulfatase A-like enzyme